MVASKQLGWPWRLKKIEVQNWRMMQLLNGSVGHGDGRRQKSKTGEDGSNHTAQVGPGDRGRKKRKKGMDLTYIWLDQPLFNAFFKE